MSATQPAVDPNEAVVSLVGVERSYPRPSGPVPALRGIDLELWPGELVALVGPSGCGKSTTLNVVAGVDRADAGRVIVAGRDLRRAGEADLVRLRREVIGVVFQAFHLLPNLTLRENVALPLALAGRRDAARIEELIARVGVADRAEHYPSELSGGEQQRAALARALVHRPRVVVADEPTGNLDSANGRIVLELLEELRREEGAAVLLATHDEQIAARADRVVHMRDGRIEHTHSAGSPV